MEDPASQEEGHTGKKDGEEEHEAFLTGLYEYKINREDLGAVGKICEKFRRRFLGIKQV